MLRQGHFFYDLRKLLGQPLLFGLVVVAAGFFILFISFQFVYLFALLIMAIFTARGIIGRRCPHCDSALKDVEAKRDKDNAFVMHIIWRCPRDGYEEDETTKVDAGLFGVG